MVRLFNDIETRTRIVLVFTSERRASTLATEITLRNREEE
jgi:hypothetical protein